MSVTVRVVAAITLSLMMFLCQCVCHLVSCDHNPTTTPINQPYLFLGLLHERNCTGCCRHHVVFDDVSLPVCVPSSLL
jgi:hypothetical protein